MRYGRCVWHGMSPFLINGCQSIFLCANADRAPRSGDVKKQCYGQYVLKGAKIYFTFFAGHHRTSLKLSLLRSRRHVCFKGACRLELRRQHVLDYAHRLVTIFMNISSWQRYCDWLRRLANCKTSCFGKALQNLSAVAARACMALLEQTIWQAV